MFHARIEREECLKCLECVKACPTGSLKNYLTVPSQVDKFACTGCLRCEEACPPKVMHIGWVSEESYGIWTPSDVYHNKKMGEFGKSETDACGARRQVPHFDSLFFVPGQLHKRPLLVDENVSTAVVIGKSSGKSIKLDIPILFSPMSFGALSKNAKTALAKASALCGTMANTGEGGMLPEEREHARHLTVQYGTGRFGISDAVLRSADMIEIKIGQGAKPGMGGKLPKEKITQEIAKVRNIGFDKDVISPARHADIKSPDDLRKKVDYLRKASDGAPVSIKIAAGDVEKDLDIALYANPDMITIDGFSGATGAAPAIAIQEVGVPTVAALARAVNHLEKVKKRKDIVLGVSGGLRNSADFAKALCLGANVVYIGTAALVQMGCVRCRMCHSNKCQAGIATQDSKAIRRFNMDRAVGNLANFLRASTEEVKTIGRILGKDDVSKFSRDDLMTTDASLSKTFDITYIYH